MVEYQITDTGISKSEITDHCNGLAIGGWEVVAVVPLNEFPRLPQTVRILSRREEVPAHDRAVVLPPDPDPLDHLADLGVRPYIDSLGRYVDEEGNIVTKEEWFRSYRRRPDQVVTP